MHDLKHTRTLLPSATIVTCQSIKISSRSGMLLCGRRWVSRLAQDVSASAFCGEKFSTNWLKVEMLHAVPDGTFKCFPFQFSFLVSSPSKALSLSLSLSLSL